MSLLNAWITPAEGLVAVDTEAVAEDGRHAQTSKLYTFVHLNALFAARGESTFHDCLSLQCHLSKVQSFDDLIEGLPAIIAATENIVKPHLGAFDGRFSNAGQEIVFVGWSQKRMRMLGWLWRKVDQMPEWEDGEIRHFHAPSSKLVQASSDASNVEQLAAAQVRYMKDVCGFGGGTLIVCRVTRSELTLKHAMTFAEQPKAAAA